MLRALHSPALALRKLLVCSTFAAGCAVGPGAARARTWRVTPDHQGDAPTVAAALDSAQAGDVVLLGPGVYSWTTEGAQLPSMLRLGAGVTLRGESGAANTELDAESRGRILECTDVGGAAVIEDLTFRNGLAPRESAVAVYGPGHAPAVRGPGGPAAAGSAGKAADDSHGGAIDCRGASAPTVRRCIFRDNHTNSGNSTGGAIACTAAAIQDCEFTGNRAGVAGFTNGEGGAVFCAAATVERCAFRDNHAWGWEAAAGGAIRCGSAVIRDCTFDGNDAACPGGPGGGAVSAAGSPLVERCAFRDNKTDAHYFHANGGALDAAAGTVRDCLFLRNTATCLQGPGRGGALTGSELTVTGSIFVDNVAQRTDPPGAGLGGAIFARFSSTVERCTFTGNSGGTAAGTGGIHCEEIATVRAVLLVQTAAGAACSGGITWVCSDLWGNVLGNALCGTDGGGNFSADPLFCADPTIAGEVTVRGNSPCLHRGAAPCDQVGAGAGACTPSAVESRTWSEWKRLYR